MNALTLCLSLGLLAFQPMQVAAAQPAHPDDLVFPELSYDAPESADYRHELAQGAVAYIVEDHRVPLVNIRITMRADDLQLSPGQEGLHIGSMELMTSGSASMDASAIEEEMAFLGARFYSRSSQYGGMVGIQTLKKDLDTGLTLLFNSLKEPTYQEDRLEQWKDERIASFKERNDHPQRIESMEWKRLMYAESYWRPATQASVEGISQQDLLNWQKRWAQPGHLVISVSGDVKTKKIIRALNAHLKNWKGKPQRFTDPAPIYNLVDPGVYFVHKEVNQCRVRCFLPGLDRDNPDWLATDMMNDILGAGGMSSWLLNRIRTEEGLAYSVGSRLGEETFGEGLFYGAFQTKSESVLFAMQLMMEEFERMLSEGVSSEELDNAKSKLIEAFPTWFNSAGTIANSMTDEELSGRHNSNPTYYADLREQVKALTVEDLNQAAKRLLKTDQLVWLLVGDEESVLTPDTEHKLKIEDFGTLHMIPLRDPLTQKALN